MNYPASPAKELVVHTTKSGIAIDPLLLADLPADYDYGSAEPEEADRDHL